MTRALATRLAALEVRMSAYADDAWTPPAFPEGYWVDVLAILTDFGYVEAVLAAVRGEHVTEDQPPSSTH